MVRPRGRHLLSAIGGIVGLESAGHLRPRIRQHSTTHRFRSGLWLGALGLLGGQSFIGTVGSVVGAGQVGHLCPVERWHDEAYFVLRRVGPLGYAGANDRLCALGGVLGERPARCVRARPRRLASPYRFQWHLGAVGRTSVAQCSRRPRRSPGVPEGWIDSCGGQITR